MVHLGERLAELREMFGLTQQELSAKLHVSNSSISAYEKNTRDPSVSLLIAMAEYFDVSTDYLLGLSKYNHPPSVMTEQLANGITIEATIHALKTLSQKQRSAILLVLNDMSICADIHRKTGRSGADTE